MEEGAAELTLSMASWPPWILAARHATSSTSRTVTPARHHTSSKSSSSSFFVSVPVLSLFL